jgi:glucose-1-phosphate thymidylyltransferase
VGYFHDMTERAVILARGLGTRMRKENPGARLDPAQQAAADRGMKAMIPVGRPFLDYVLSGLADAGLRAVCLVIGPEHDAMRERYAGATRPRRVSVSFAIQERPLGTADAVLAAEEFAAGESVLMLNSDNLYPRSALESLRSLRPSALSAHSAGLVGFRQAALLSMGSIQSERIRAFALISVRTDGTLERIVEKPDQRESLSFGPNPLVSMNAWVLPPTIYAASRAITPSSRGELELQDAVRYAMEHLGERFRVVESEDPVLDLSSREDIPAVASRLAGVEVRL